MGIEARFRTALGEFELDVEASLAAHGVTALFGPSGAGKTSVLRCMAGLERAPQGVFRVGDQTWQEESRAIFVPPHRRSIGVVFQDVGLFPHLTVRKNLDYGRRRAASADRPSSTAIDADDVVELLALRDLLERYPDRLSGGEAHRVAIARSLLTQPRLLLMDEPLTGLDVGAKAEIMGYLERLFRQLAVPVVYVSHSLDEVARLADAMLIMEGGRITTQGSPTELLARFDLPVAHTDAAGAVIEATVDGHDHTYDLTHLAFAGGRLTTPRRELELGTPVRVRIQARDVSLVLDRPRATSILNVLPARIVERADESRGQVLVRLAAGEATLLARVTRKSADQLGLHPGQDVYAQVKSVSLLR